MRTEPQRTEKCLGNDIRMLAQSPANNRVVELVREQALLASGQEIADLYHMLRYKCKQGAQRLSVF